MDEEKKWVGEKIVTRKQEGKIIIQNWKTSGKNMVTGKLT